MVTFIVAGIPVFRCVIVDWLNLLIPASKH